MKAYLGRAGHLATMAEFLVRGYNVAIPEVDTGDDVFVVHDLAGVLYRVQIKTASPKRLLKREAGFSAQFNVGFEQLRAARIPDLNYVFTVRRDHRWAAWLLATRQELYALHADRGVGSRSGDGVVFRFTFRDGATTSNGVDLTAHRDAWDRYWPPLL